MGRGGGGGARGYGHAGRVNAAGVQLDRQERWWGEPAGVEVYRYYSQAEG